MIRESNENAAIASTTTSAVSISNSQKHKDHMKRLDDEMREYKLLGSLDVGVDIIQFWLSNKLKFPILHEMAMDIFCSPITETSIDGVFSELPLFLSKYRYNVESELLEKMIVLRRNHIYMGKNVLTRDIE